jgi:hypothetical protein
MSEELLQRTLSLLNPARLDLQLKEQRRTVDFDTFDIQIQELVRMLGDGEIWVAPAYQRKFRWDQKRCSQLVESILLGIPIPSLMMATNANSTWEVVDGVQRLSAIVKFMANAELRGKLKVKDSLALFELQKLTAFEGMGYADLPAHIQLHFRTRPLKVITLNDKSDTVVRYDLFERLNTGGVALSAQEIRDCVFQGEFSRKLEEWSLDSEFRKVITLTARQQTDGTAEECVLRFFAYLHKYKEFVHGVTSFLNSYMEQANKSFDYEKNDALFHATFSELAAAFPKGISRPARSGTTPLNLFEGVTVGAALALQQAGKLVTTGIQSWLAHEKLREFTTGATNRPAAVTGRIEFCRDRFLGKPYVEPAAN